MKHIFMFLFMFVAFCINAQTLNFKSNVTHFVDNDGHAETAVETNIKLVDNSVYVNGELWGSADVEWDANTATIYFEYEKWVFKLRDGRIHLVVVYPVLGANIIYENRKAATDKVIRL